MELTQERYEQLEDMFTHPGWEIFVGDVAELEEALVQNAPDSAATNDQWQYARGMIRQLRSIIGYEDYIKLAYNESQREPDDVDSL